MKMITNGVEGLELQLEQLGGRAAAKRIVAAGCNAAIKVLQTRARTYHHVVTGSMQEHIAPGLYHEDIDACWQDVYPQEYDSRGISNATKAFVINYGYGGRKTDKTGDKFITGNHKPLKDAVSQAMAAEAERIKNEIMR